MSWPNWKDKSEYDGFKQAISIFANQPAGKPGLQTSCSSVYNIQQWKAGNDIAWEFLRRNKEFQRDYEHALRESRADPMFSARPPKYSEPRAPNPALSVMRKWHLRLTVRLPNPHESAFEFEPHELNGGPFQNQYLHDNAQLIAHFSRFRFSRIPRIIINIGDLSDLLMRSETSATQPHDTKEDYEDADDGLLDATNIVVVLSLKDSIDVQLKRIKPHLLQLGCFLTKQSKSSPKSSSWLSALRVWDAETEGLDTLSSRANRLELTPKQYARDLKTATALVNAGYLEVVRRAQDAVPPPPSDYHLLGAKFLE